MSAHCVRAVWLVPMDLRLRQQFVLELWLLGPVLVALLMAVFARVVHTVVVLLCTRLVVGQLVQALVACVRGLWLLQHLVLGSVRNIQLPHLRLLPVELLQHSRLLPRLQHAVPPRHGGGLPRNF